MCECKDEGVEEYFRDQAKPENRRKLALWMSKLDGVPPFDLVAHADQAPAGSPCDAEAHAGQ